MNILSSIQRMVLGYRWFSQLLWLFDFYYSSLFHFCFLFFSIIFLITDELRSVELNFGKMNSLDLINQEFVSVLYQKRKSIPPPLWKLFEIYFCDLGSNFKIFFTSRISPWSSMIAVNPFMQNVEKTLILLKSYDVNTGRCLKYVWPFFIIMH